MAFTSTWYKRPNVYYIHCWGDVTLTDLADAIDATIDAKSEMASNQMFFHTITNLQDVHKIPLNIKQIMDATKDLKGNSVNGWAIVVGNMNPLVQFVLSTMGQMFKFRIRLFPTLEEGLAFLNEVDPFLPPMLPMSEDFELWVTELLEQVYTEVAFA
jgi:hypothetical protein